jgi:hypothetical protein
MVDESDNKPEDDFVNLNNERQVVELLFNRCKDSGKSSTTLRACARRREQISSYYFRFGPDKVRSLGLCSGS